MKQKNIIIIIPAHNEAGSIEKVLTDIATTSRLPVVVVDDGSSDQTARLASSYTDHVIVHQENSGKGAAMRTGAEYAFSRLIAEAVIFMDGDGQHDAKNLDQFIKIINSGENIVFGVRKMEGQMPADRLLANRFTSLITKLLFGVYIPDIPSGFKALTRKAYQQLAWSAQGYEVEIEIAVKVAKQRLPFFTVPITTLYFGKEQGMNARDSLRVITHLLSLRLRGRYN